MDTTADAYMYAGVRMMRDAGAALVADEEVLRPRRRAA